MNKRQLVASGALSLVLVLVTRQITRPRDDPEFGIDDLAVMYGAPQADLMRLLDMREETKRKGGEMTDEDWNFAVKWIKSTNMDMAGTALGAIGEQSPSSSRRDQIVDLAIKNLDNPNRAGTVTGILVLRKFGDPRWQKYLAEFANSSNPESAKLGKQLQKRYGVIP